MSKGKVGPIGNKRRVRASGGGAKKQFPHLMDEVQMWLERERSHPMPDLVQLN